MRPDPGPAHWPARAEQAQRLGDWDTAIALVSARAACHSPDYYAHDHHLWHLDLLARAGRLAELTRLARTDVHARRRLNTALRERGMDEALRGRAEDGDRGALYGLVRLLCESGRAGQARRAVHDLGPQDEHAHRILARFPGPEAG